MESDQPYLSVVVTARNDDHGGNLLGRVQIFVNGWIAQARKYNLPSELILVEWNPPADRPGLQDVLRWPQDFGPCDIRFIEVPEELHRRYQHAEALPLYQMIAKNVGILRARGRFVLATNIDILFSDELMAFLAEQRLDAGRMYRIDRHDAMSDVPLEADIEEQLAYCCTHLLRVNAREGTFPLTPDGRRALAKKDIAAADSGISFGYGWFPVEQYWDGKVFRWVDNDAELEVSLPAGPSTLLLEVEPGPAMGGRTLVLEVCEGTRVVVRTEVRYHSLLRIPSSLLGPDKCDLRLHVMGGGDAVAHDPRILNLRVFSCRVDRTGARRARITAVASAPARACQALVRIWLGFQELLNRMAASGPVLTITLPVSKSLSRRAAFYVGWGGFTGMFRNWAGYLARRLTFRSNVKVPCAQPIKPPPEAEKTSRIPYLHTNACGDFTLAARARWLDLRGYPEFDMYSMNIDSIFCYAANYGGAPEEVLREPMRIYHIEHGVGSGWTPEGEAKLYARLAAKGLSWVSYRDLVTWAAQMRQLNCPMIFNHDNWGLAEFELKESRPHPGQVPASLHPTVRRAGDSE
ncbi:MAG TPA: hypothetical protein VG096_22430 [Bryobacteraceae bacterium]|jgi:hypothetical protein|nr:hypothetical protein [Bryobacteraceae bacterium]